MLSLLQTRNIDRWHRYVYITRFKSLDHYWLEGRTQALEMNGIPYSVAWDLVWTR